jgi:hypothetical protein
MLAAVQLDNQPTVKTAEVCDIVSYRGLASELGADQSSISENTPELELSFRHFSPHPPRTIEDYRVCGWSSPHSLKGSAFALLYLSPRERTRLGRG